MGNKRQPGKRPRGSIKSVPGSVYREKIEPHYCLAVIKQYNWER
jgi:hypothetical protein